jgi:hypothetical protein
MYHLHLSPEFVDERMLLSDFLAACDFIDDLSRRG